MTPPGYRAGLEFSLAWEIPPGYRVGLEFAPNDEPPGDVQRAYPAGFDALEWGEPATRLAIAFLAPPSIQEATAAGFPVVDLYTRYVRPAGVSGRLAFGTATLLNFDKDVYPAGARMDVHGQPTIYNLDRYLTLGGIPAKLAFGAPTIFNTRRYYSLSGFNALRFGTAFVQGGLVEVGVAPISAPALSGPWVSRSPRELAPVGIFREFPAQHMVGGTRWLEPFGFEATRWGERILPESQSVYPPGGVHSLFGSAHAWNYNTLVKPVGFKTHNGEDQRFGALHAWNLARYVQVAYDPNDGLSPPAQTGWTSIHNRNRVITHHSTPPSGPPRPEVALAGRQMLPGGIGAPDWPEGYRSGMVAYRIRSVRPDAVEAPHFSRWSQIHNAAPVLRPAGFDGALYGLPAAQNTRRYFPWIGGVEADLYGTPMVADRIRTLKFEARYSIGAPVLPLPMVKLHTRYVDGIGGDLSGIGVPFLRSHKTTITPRWALVHYFGWPAVCNLTPEVRTHGRALDEFGDSFVRLGHRYVSTHEMYTQWFGKPIIADKTRRIAVGGFNAQRLGMARVVRTGTVPYATQYVWLDGENGKGIAPVNGQVPRPAFNQAVLYVTQISANTRMGEPRVTANSIRVEPGYWELLTGEPAVSLRIRRMAVTGPASAGITVGRPRVSPHTIYSVTEAPQQAMINHPTGNSLHYVNAGERFGSVRLTLRQRYVRPAGGLHQQLGAPSVANRRIHVRPSGFGTMRFGWHEIPGGLRELVQFDSRNTGAVGSPHVGRPPEIVDRTLKCSGLSAQQFGATRIDLFHREVKPVGHYATLMGTRLSGDSPYMWHGLRVGPRMPTIPSGADMGRYGAPWVSFRVREVVAEGFDDFRCEYQLEAFDRRMRVGRRDAHAPARAVAPQGFMGQVGTPDARRAVHYIRPDGNAEQFRKGAF